MTGCEVTFETDIQSSTVTYWVDNESSKKGGEKIGQKTQKIGQKSGEKIGQKPRKIGQKNRELIVKIIKDNPYITTKQLSVIFDLDRSGISRFLNTLKESGILHREGPDKGGHWVILKDWDRK
ncbi:MAG: winged helix-turn-helix transcriptional regulator [Bacteroidales bacterium]|nr:winged helix-turn-helix transcriptional regulator [Bacteroidales bacterium]